MCLCIILLKNKIFTQKQQNDFHAEFLSFVSNETESTLVFVSKINYFIFLLRTDSVCGHLLEAANEELISLLHFYCKCNSDISPCQYCDNLCLRIQRPNVFRQVRVKSRILHFLVLCFIRATFSGVSFYAGNIRSGAVYFKMCIQRRHLVCHDTSIMIS